MPSNKAILDWFMSQPDGTYTCADCGVTGPKGLVQPQHPAFVGGRTDVALCPQCIAARNKRALDQMPRCEVTGCAHRATWTVAGVYLCGWHKRKAEKGFHRAMSKHVLGPLLIKTDRNSVLRWAVEG
jgi:hypothetical protein